MTRKLGATLEDLLSVRTPNEIVVSPDGELLAITAIHRGEYYMPAGARFPSGATTFDAGCHLYVLDPTDGEARELGQFDRSWRPTWNRDGDKLIFFGDRADEIAVWQWDRETNQVTRAIQETISYSESLGLGWDQKGTGVIVTLRPQNGSSTTSGQIEPSKTFDYFSAEKTEEEPKGLSVNIQGQDLTKDIAVVNIESRETRRVVKDLAVRLINASPDGRWVTAVGHLNRPKMNSFRHFLEISVFSVDDGQLLHVIEESRSLLPSWSPDSTKVAIALEGKLMVQHIEGDAVRFDELPELLDEGGIALFWTPLWDESSRFLLVPNSDCGLLVVDTETGSHVELDVPYKMQLPRAPLVFQSSNSNQFWSPDGGSCVVATRNEEDVSREVWRLPLDGSKATRFGKGDNTSTIVPDLMASQPAATEVGRDGATVFYRTEDEAHPPEVWKLGRDGTTKKVSNFNSRFENADLPNAIEVKWINADGSDWAGTLLLPPSHKPGETVPIVVDSYPVPTWGHMRDHWEGPQVIFKQLLVSQGYGVFIVGGAAPMNLPSLQHLCNPVLTGLNELVRMGVADDRFAIMGQSGGGFLVNSMVTLTDRFKAAVSFVSVSNWASHFGQLWPMQGGPLMHGVTNATNICGGPPWENPQRYIDLSPVFFLNRVTTPLLLMSGVADYGVFVQQADEMFVGLRHLGKEVELLRYHGEGHGMFSEPNRSHMIESVLAFFEKHLS